MTDDSTPLDTPLSTPLGTALHDRVRDEHPDLDLLVRAATSRGTRIRRRRRAGASLAVVAGVAVVAVAGNQLTGSHGTTHGGAPIASEPTASPTPPSTSPTTPVPPPGATVVFVDAPGWRCDRPADEKFMCHKEGDWVVVNWRGSDERRYYLDPDKADVVPGVHTYVSEAHGKWFATVAPADGTSQHAVDEVGMNLVWVD